MCAGANTTGLTLVGHNGTISKWQYSIDGGSTWQDSLVSSNPITINNITTTTQYRVVVGKAGCTAVNSSVATLTVVAPPVTSSITGNPKPNCSAVGEVYSVVKTVGSKYSWKIPIDAQIVSATPDSDQVTINFGITNGSISVTETNSDGCVGTPVTLPFTLVGCALKANFEVDIDSVCTTNSVEFKDLSTGTSSNTNYAWDFGTGATPATANTKGPHIVTYNSIALANASVKLKITEGVSDSTTKVNYITILPKNTASLSSAPNSDNQSICLGDIINNITYSTTGATGIGSAVNLPPGVTALFSGNATAGTITISGKPTASGTYSYSIPLVGGCDPISVSGTIKVNDLPTTSPITGNPTPNCSATGEVYSVVRTVGSKYSWSIPSDAQIVSATTDSDQVTINFGTINDTISVTETNSNGCVGTTKKLPISLVGCALKADFNANITTVCTGNNVVFTNTSTGTSAGSNYAWDFGAGATPATATTFGPHTVTYNGNGTADVQLTITDGITSTTLKTKYITINATNNASLSSAPNTQNQKICLGDNLTPIVYVTTGATGIPNNGIAGTNGLPAGVMALWKNDTLTISGTPTQAGKFKYSIQLQGGCGTYIVSDSITVNPLLIASVSIVVDNSTVCAGTSVTFTAQPTNGGSTPSFQWQVNGNTMGKDSIGFKYVPTDKDQVQVIMTSNATSCLTGNPATSNIIPITVNTVLPPSLVSNPVFCTSDGATVNSLNSFVVEKSITWYDAPTAGTQLSVNDIVKTGTYYASQTINGCESANRLPVPVTVYPNPVIATQPLPTQTVYLGDSVEPLTVTYTSGSGSPTYQWYRNTSPSNQGGKPITGDTLASYTPSSASSGTFYYYCEMKTADGGCSVVSDVALLKVLLIGIVVTADTTILQCPHDDNGQITLHIMGGTPYKVGRAPYNITWKGPDGEVIDDKYSDSIPAFTVNPVDSALVYHRTLRNLKAGVYEVTVSDTVSTEVVKKYTIVEPSEINIKATIKKSSLANNQRGEIFAEVTGGTPPYHFTWKLKNRILPDISPRITNLGPGTYELAVRDSNNCPPVTAQFKIDEDLAVNTFSPNGDGTNDLFMENLFLQVFNRNGILLYEGTSGWDGTFNNQPVQDDTYMYVVKYKSDGEYEYKTGYVTVVR